MQLKRVSIPQAVGTVATLYSIRLMKINLIVSIPQAVGTVATNNGTIPISELVVVSIPQAVGTVATVENDKALKNFIDKFQYRKR